jgi:hypothetical protein
LPEVPEIHVLRDEDLPPCTRCGIPVLFITRVPVGSGRDVDLELCGSCDRNDPAGGRLLQVLEAPAAAGPLPEMVKVTVAWIRAAMAAKGWAQIPHQRESLN